MKLIIFKNKNIFRDEILEETLEEIKSVSLKHNERIEFISDIENIKTQYLNNKFSDEKIIFILPLNEYGINFEYYQFLETIRSKHDGFNNSVGGIITLGNTKLYTKNISRELAFTSNTSGLTLIGKSLVEKVENFSNFKTISKINSCSRFDSFKQSIVSLVERLLNFHADNKIKKEKINLLALHTSHFTKSNTLNLWHLVKNYLEEDLDVNEINLDTRTIQDCRGCKHETCLHFAKEESCYYGGFMVKELYPRVLASDAIMLICPNYNDSTGANITAFINRLTSLYKMHNFEEKYIFSVIVSGYSGGDIVASQVLGAFNMNKGFILPSNFSLIETANLSGEIYEVENVENKAKIFAENILKTILND